MAERRSPSDEYGKFCFRLTVTKTKEAKSQAERTATETTQPTHLMRSMPGINPPCQLRRLSHALIREISGIGGHKRGLTSVHPRGRVGLLPSVPVLRPNLGPILDFNWAHRLESANFSLEI